MASSYLPSPATPNSVQIPDSQPTGDAVMGNTNAPTSAPLELIPFVRASSVPVLPMDMGNRHNTEKTGLGDSQHAHLEPPLSILTTLSDPSLPYPMSSELPHPPPGSHPRGQTQSPRLMEEKRVEAYSSPPSWPESGRLKKSPTPSRQPVAVSKQTQRRNGGRLTYAMSWTKKERAWKTADFLRTSSTARQHARTLSTTCRFSKTAWKRRWCKWRNACNDPTDR